MKIRLDYVTNSSSSSYIVAYKLNSGFDNIKDKIKEEFGNYGLGIVETGCCSGHDIIQDTLDYIKRDDEYSKKTSWYNPEKYTSLIQFINGEIDEWNDDCDFDDFEICGESAYGKSIKTIITEAVKDKDALYVVGSRIEYSNEGDTDSDSLFIVDTICYKCGIDFEVVIDRN